MKKCLLKQNMTRKVINMQNLKHIKNKKGFTLIEMLIVILIIVILLAIAVPSVITYRKDSQRTADIGAAKTLYTALEATLTTYGELSDAEMGLDYFGGTTVLVPSQGRAPNNVIPTTVSVWNFPFASQASAKLGNEFYGKYKFGYDTTTNSIVWVSYHHDKNTIEGGNTAADSHVMIYDIANNVEGYATELGAPYNAAPYVHR